MSAHAALAHHAFECHGVARGERGPRWNMSMKPGKQEVQQRTAAALAAIKRAATDPDSSVALFVSHHLQEIDAAYWKEHGGTARPSVQQVLGLLQLREHWDDDGMEIFDFTLPGDVTDYVISVRFGEDGKVQDVEMES